MTRTGLALLVIVAWLAGYATASEAHYTPSCEKAPCKKHVIEPYKQSFLAPVGDCESGASRSLRSGLDAHSPAGYHGRYQFGLGSWRGAGGSGDPHNHGWLEQGYRAVVWLHRNGRDSWPNC